MSKEGILSIYINTKDRAQRYQPSKFCGSTFDILRFAVKCNQTFEPVILIKIEYLTTESHTSE